LHTEVFHMVPSETKFSSRTFQQSEALMADASRLFPGGVNSPVRAFGGVGGSPVVMQRAEGPYLWDVDGNRYIDYVGSWGPAILGHAHPSVVRAVQETAANGLSFGTPNALENQLAEKVMTLMPHLERLRFVNSGTEAALSAIRLARAVTAREKLIKFEGCYHGHVDALLLKAGSGATTLGMPNSAGVPSSTVAATLLAPFNDLAAVGALFERYPDEIAGVLIEPVAGNMGCVLPKPGFLEGLRALCDKFGALLVFDEVMTGFRVALGGATAQFGVTPDITVLGKIIGGGLPVGAYGATHAVMKWVSPEGPMYQAGTLSGNPVAMASGLATLEALSQPGVFERAEQAAAQLVAGLKSACSEASIAASGNNLGAMAGLFFTENSVENYTDALKSDTKRFARFFHGMLQSGVYLPPSQFEAFFLSTVHSPEVIEETLSITRCVLATLQD
jgi:glutamate-1-semialdehyde 2,1-aminomutase